MITIKDLKSTFNQTTGIFRTVELNTLGRHLFSIQRLNCNGCGEERLIAGRVDY
jgi:hypothetical protein